MIRVIAFAILLVVMVWFILFGLGVGQSVSELSAAELPTSALVASERKADKPDLRGQTFWLPKLVQTGRFPVRESRFTWPGLGQDKTVALGEALKKAGFQHEVVIWCATVDCNDLAADLDDAFQIADVKSDLDRREVESSSDTGIFVGPRGPDAEKLISVINSTTGLTATIVEAPHDAPLALIIGRRPR